MKFYRWVGYKRKITRRRSKRTRNHGMNWCDVMILQQPISEHHFISLFFRWCVICCRCVVDEQDEDPTLKRHSSALDMILTRSSSVFPSNFLGSAKSSEWSRKKTKRAEDEGDIRTLIFYRYFFPLFHEI